MGLAGSLRLEELATEVAEGRIHTVVTAFPDLYGRLVGKRIHAPFFLGEVARHGMHVCDYLLACDMEMDPTPGYEFTGWETGYGDMLAVPDLGTLRRLAWLPGTAAVLCDLLHEEGGGPVEVAPRRILARQVERARHLGLEPQMGSELEFFLVREDYDEARTRGYRGLRPTGRYIEDYHILSGTFAEPVIGRIRREVDASGIPVEFSKGEWGPGQHEINLRYAPALEMADRHVLYKQAAREIAASEGASITFMAKWREDLAGSSLHVHLSLCDGAGRSAFAGDRPLEPDGPGLASPTFLWFVGGLLAHLRELSLLLAPNPNSYKRFREGTFAPTRIAWSLDNRTAGLRVVGRGESLRVECRVPGADANPYLVYAALLAAGLEGLEREIAPPPPLRGDAYRREDVPRVPRRLPEAIEAFAASDLARRAFGDAVVRHLLHFARSEQAVFDAAVTDVERGRYYERV